MSKVYLLLIVCASMNCSTKEVSKDLNAFNLKGNILKVEETNYSVLKKFGEYEGDTINSSLKLEFNEDGDLILLDEFEKNKFGSFGQIIKRYHILIENKYSSNHFLTDKLETEKEDNSIFKRVYNYKYGQNNLLERTQRIVENGNFKDTFLIFYKYNSANQLIEEDFVPMTFWNGKVKYTYDAKGHLQSKFEYGSNGLLENRYNYEYGDNDSIVKIFEYEGEDENLVEKTDITYDLNGNIIKKHHHETNDEKIELLEYNKFKDDVSYKLMYLGRAFFDVRYEYQYDDKNNWVKRIHFVDNKATDISIRKITYYPN